MHSPLLTEEDLQKATPEELERYKQLLERDIARKSPLDLAETLFPETRRWQHLQLLNEYLLALSEYRLTAEGPVPAEQVRWWFIPAGSAEKLQADDPHSIPENVDSYGADTPKGPVVFRLSISMMPRAGKSRLTTETFPLWLLLNDPEAQIALGTYSDSFAWDWGGATRDLMMRLRHDYPWLPQPAGGLRAGREVFSVDGHLGKIRYTGVGGGITGRGFQVMIGDDFIKNDAEAQSPAERKNAHNFYDTTWKSRKTRDLRPNAKYPIPIEVLMATRWHESDVTGYACYDDEGQPLPDWCILSVPALAEDEDTDPLSRREGEAHPNAAGLTRADLEDLRRDNARVFSALYQGRPSPEEGGIIPTTFSRFVPVDRKGERYLSFHKDGSLVQVQENETICFAAADMASTTKTTADYTVVGVFRYSREHEALFLIDLLREKMTSDQYVERIAPFVTLHNVSITLVENVTYGQTFEQLMRRKGYRVDTVPVVSDKVARALASNLPDIIRRGNFYLPAGAAFEARLITEVGLFPFGDHDDQVDVLAFAAAHVTNMPLYKAKPPAPEKTLGDLVDEHVDKQVQNRKAIRRRDPYSRLRRRM